MQLLERYHWRIQGGARDAPVQFFFIFMRFLRIVDQNHRLVPLSFQLAPHPLGNPGSATAYVKTNHWRFPFTLILEF